MLHTLYIHTHKFYLKAKETLLQRDKYRYGRQKTLRKNAARSHGMTFLSNEVGKMSTGILDDGGFFQQTKATIIHNTI
jgi:hypothetical protein